MGGVSQAGDVFSSTERVLIYFIVCFIVCFVSFYFEFLMTTKVHLNKSGSSVLQNKCTCNTSPRY